MDRLIPLIRFNLVLLAGILVCTAMFYGRQILILVAFAALFSMLMNPVANKLESNGVNRIWSTILCLLILLLVLTVITALVFSQFRSIGEQMPQIQQKVEKYLADLQTFVQQQFNLSPQKQIEMLKGQMRAFGQSAGKYASYTITGTVGLLAYLVMILVFMFLFLLQREKYKNFFIWIYKDHSRQEAEEVVDSIVKVTHKYLTGILMSMILLTVLYGIGFLIVGIKNAVLLAAIAASLIIIPYIGAFIGGFFPFMMALLTEDSIGPAIGVIGVMVFIQIIDNNLIEPYIVGGQVKLSAVASILALFTGGALWGIPGVILFLPLTGILKIFFDHSRGMKPYAYLIGDQQQSSPSSLLKKWMKKKWKKK